MIHHRTNESTDTYKSRNILTGVTTTHAGQVEFAYLVAGIGATSTLDLAVVLARAVDPDFELPGVEMKPNTRYRTRGGNIAHVCGPSPYRNLWVGITAGDAPLVWDERGRYRQDEPSSLDLVQEI